MTQSHSRATIVLTEKRPKKELYSSRIWRCETLPYLTFARFNKGHAHYLFKLNLRSIVARKTFSVLVAFIFSSAMISGCGMLELTKKEVIKADYDVEITDPSIRRITDITSNIRLVASGVFAPGTYLIGKTPVAIAPNTSFEVKLSLPVTDPKLISTHDATGTFSVSQPISVMAVPVPLTISLYKGTVSGEMNLARSIAAFFVNLLQVGVISGDTHQMIQSMKIKKAELELRPGSELKFGPKIVIVAPDSLISLTDVAVDKAFNYQANCKIDINFGKHCKWIGQRVDTEFDGGKTCVSGRATKRGNQLILSLQDDPEKPAEITLKHCKFSFGKFKRCHAVSDECLLHLKEFNLRHTMGNDEDNLHLLSGMDLIGTNLTLKTDIHQTDAYFPDTVPANLQVDLTPGSASSTHFSTEGDSIAKTGTIKISKRATSLTLFLGDTKIGKVSYDKFGALAFVLEKGTSKLKRLEWQGNKSNFSLTTTGVSTLTLPSSMLLEKGTGTEPTKLKLPLKLEFGEGELRTPKSVIKLADLNGSLFLDVDKEVQLTSSVDFSIQHSKLLGAEEVDVKVRGIDLTMIQNRANLHLNSCNLVLPEKALAEAISRRIPNHLNLDIDKTISEDKRWRYRNAKAKSVKIDNLVISDMKAQGSGALSFTATGDAVIEGTVEKGAILFKTSEWKECPWKLEAELTGDGLVKYAFLCDTDSSRSKVKYDLKMDLPLPEGMRLDWSQVTSGLMRIVERRIIVKRLRKTTIPVSHKGEIDLFEAQDSRWRNFKLTKVAMRSKGDNIQIDFTADAVF